MVPQRRRSRHQYRAIVPSPLPTPVPLARRWARAWHLTPAAHLPLYAGKVRRPFAEAADYSDPEWHVWPHRLVKSPPPPVAHPHLDGRADRPPTPPPDFLVAVSRSAERRLVNSWREGPPPWPGVAVRQKGESSVLPVEPETVQPRRWARSPAPPPFGGRVRHANPFAPALAIALVQPSRFVGRPRDWWPPRPGWSDRRVTATRTGPVTPPPDLVRRGVFRKQQDNHAHYTGSVRRAGPKDKLDDHNVRERRWARTTEPPAFAGRAYRRALILREYLRFPVPGRLVRTLTPPPLLAGGVIRGRNVPEDHSDTAWHVWLRRWSASPAPPPAPGATRRSRPVASDLVDAGARVKRPRLIHPTVPIDRLDGKVRRGPLRVRLDHPRVIERRTVWADAPPPFSGQVTRGWIKEQPDTETTRRRGASSPQPPPFAGNVRRGPVIDKLEQWSRLFRRDALGRVDPQVRPGDVRRSRTTYRPPPILVQPSRRVRGERFIPFPGNARRGDVPPEVLGDPPIPSRFMSDPRIQAIWFDGRTRQGRVPPVPPSPGTDVEHEFNVDVWVLPLFPVELYL